MLYVTDRLQSSVSLILWESYDDSKTKNVSALAYYTVKQSII